MKPKSTYRVLPRISFHAPLKISLALSLMLGSANAAIIASYIDGVTTTGGNLAAPVAGITVSNLTSTGIVFTTVTSLSRTSGGVETLTTPAGPTFGSAAGSRWLSALNTEVANTTTPVSTTDYYSFTVTTSSGTLPSFATLTFDMVVGAVNSNGGMTGYYQLFAAADGGSFAAVGLGGSATDDGTPDLFPGNQVTSIGDVITASIDLTGLATANSYEFRIALGDSSGAGVKPIWLQGIQLTTIPEPSSALLGGLGLLVLLRRRR